MRPFMKNVFSSGGCGGSLTEEDEEVGEERVVEVAPDVGFDVSWFFCAGVVENVG